MSLLPGSTLIYRCSFEIEPVQAQIDVPPWKAIVKMIRKWIKEAPASNPPETNDVFGKGWIYWGGQWQSPGRGYHRVIASRYLGSGNDDCPEHWALQYEHGCSITRGRNWRTDIAVASLGETRFRVTVNVSHYMMPGYFFPEDDSVELTVPRIVRTIFDSPLWVCYSGAEILASGPKMLEIGSGITLREMLSDPNHAAPVVLVSRLNETGTPLLNSNDLARCLIGAASVYESSSIDVDAEIRSVLGDEFRCDNGSVRVYYPPVRFESPRDQRRHPYRPRFAIVETGPDAMRKSIASLIVTRPGSYEYGNIESVQDVDRLLRELKRADFTDRAAAISLDAHDRAAFEELLSEAQESMDQSAEEAQHFREAAELEKLLREEAEEALRGLEYWQQEARKAQHGERGAQESLRRLANELVKLPTTAIECVSAIEIMFDGRIAFTDRGRESSGQSAISTGELWTVLYQMSTVLYDLLFSATKPAASLPEAFQSATGLELALTERKLTKANAKIADQRLDVFDGQQIDVTPHVKFHGSTTRAYWGRLEYGDRRLIVIGYVGHLDTSGTHKLSGR